MRVFREVEADFPANMVTILQGLPVDDAYELEKELERFKIERGYKTHDTAVVTPETPNQALKKYDAPHTHSEDEVRLFVEGSGIFDLRDDEGTWYRFVLSKGDMIIVPAGRVHRFEPTYSKSLQCVRIFQDEAGWVPNYVD